ncbi:MAG TPA: hypothetical protein VKF14_07120 [Candidatus Dormibacteraeota bacterium]|nr:hypothetical protein [Candidatus Dormibacteraeota bacterium]
MEKRGLDRALHRRDVLKLGLAGLVASELFLLNQLARMPERLSLAVAPSLPDIQFDIGNFIAPAFTINGVLVRFGPVFTFFTPARLTRTPSMRDRAVFAEALGTIEAEFRFSPRGLFTFVAYGIPYFNRLAGGLHGRLVSRYLPRLTSDPSRYVLEEAVPSPTDVSPRNPGITKKKFNVPVVIEHNDVLFTLRSDSIRNLLEIQAWLRGSGILRDRRVESPDFDGLFQFQRTRVMFQQIGLPRKVAEANNLPFTRQINPQSPMWMGFADQQVDASGPAAIVTFVGNPSARLTSAEPGSYFDNGSIQHLSHDILDLAEFYQLAHVDPDHPDGEPYAERVQYMFRANELGTLHGLPSEGNADQFTDGGGPAFLNNRFQGANDAFLTAQDADGTFAPPPKGKQTQRATFTGTSRIGHISALQRSSRAKDGTPIHIRMDGTGFDNLDVPDGTRQPKLEFTAFVPSAEFFRAMRANAAAQDLQAQFKVDPDDNGIERFMTATRRQNFLAPPRRHRAFPLLEYTGGR